MAETSIGKSSASQLSVSTLMHGSLHLLTNRFALLSKNEFVTLHLQKQEPALQDTRKVF